MRIMLAAEGPTDELVARELIQYTLGDISITCKKFPSRGFAVVSRLIELIVRAAYYGHYDLLIVHFDLNSTLPLDSFRVHESPRWQEIHSKAAKTRASLPDIPTRPRDFETLFMTPCESTEAWLLWGEEDGRGTDWEHLPRHELKRKLFGTPARNVSLRTREVIGKLRLQMNVNPRWPNSLKVFIDGLHALASPP